MFTYSEFDKKAIQYDLKRVDDGWSLMVTLPTRTSNSDNAKVFNWICQYQKIVKKLHPEWFTSFRVMDCGYVLLIQPCRNTDDLLKIADFGIAGEEIRNYWTHEVECA